MSLARTSEVKYELVPLQFVLKQIPRVEIRVYRGVWHDDVLLLGAHWILVHKTPGVLHIEINRRGEVNHLLKWVQKSHDMWIP